MMERKPKSCKQIILRPRFWFLKFVPSWWFLLIFLSPATCLTVVELKEDPHIPSGPQDDLFADERTSINVVSNNAKFGNGNSTDVDVAGSVRVVIEKYLNIPRLKEETAFETSPYRNNASILAKNVPEVISTDPVVSQFHNDGLWLGFQWWQILLVFLASLLLISICLYFTGFCFLTADCCSDPYWCCCPSCSVCLGPAKPPIRKRKSKKKLKIGDISSPSTLQDSSIYKIKPGKKQEKPAKMFLASQEIIDESFNLSNNHSQSHLNSTVDSKNNMEENVYSNNLISTDTGTAKSVKSNRKIIESLPLTIDKDQGDYKWYDGQHHLCEGKKKLNLRSLNLFSQNRSKQYTISTAERRTKRHSQYRFIADFQSTVVIATKISKKLSTASNYLVKPEVGKRSKSLTSVESLQDLPSDKSGGYSPLAGRRL